MERKISQIEQEKPLVCIMVSPFVVKYMCKRKKTQNRDDSPNLQT